MHFLLKRVKCLVKSRFFGFFNLENLVIINEAPKFRHIIN
jgi:hypothetical protein